MVSPEIIYTQVKLNGLNKLYFIFMYLYMLVTITINEKEDDSKKERGKDMGRVEGRKRKG